MSIKLAQVPKPRSHRNPATEVPSTHQSNRQNVSGNFSSAIKNMQVAILDFANAASASDITNMKGNLSGKIENSKEYLGGSDPFGDFLAKNYVNQPADGKQYLNVDVKSPNRDKASIKDTGLRGIIDTIKRIGTPGSIGTEKSVDGIWGERTNNSLKNIYSVAYAMLHLANDMGLSVPGLSDESVSQLNKNIPENENISQDKKNILAISLTQEIKDLTKIFAAFKKFVLENNEYKSYIDQNKSFVQYKQKENKDADLSDQEKKILQQSSNKSIPDIKVNNNEISLNDLNNMDTFSKFMQRIGKDPKNPEEIKTILAEISMSLNKLNPGY